MITIHLNDTSCDFSPVVTSAIAAGCGWSGEKPSPRQAVRLRSYNEKDHTSSDDPCDEHVLAIDGYLQVTTGHLGIHVWGTLKSDEIAKFINI